MIGVVNQNGPKLNLQISELNERLGIQAASSYRNKPRGHSQSALQPSRHSRYQEDAQTIAVWRSGNHGQQTVEPKPWANTNSIKGSISGQNPRTLSWPQPLLVITILVRTPLVRFSLYRSKYIPITISIYLYIYPCHSPPLVPWSFRWHFEYAWVWIALYLHGPSLATAIRDNPGNAGSYAKLTSCAAELTHVHFVGRCVNEKLSTYRASPHEHHHPRIFPQTPPKETHLLKIASFCTFREDLHTKSCVLPWRLASGTHGKLISRDGASISRDRVNL